LYSYRELSKYKGILSFIAQALFIIRILFAGMPPTTVLSGTSFETTAPAATIAFSPTVTPGKTTTPAPIQTFLSVRGRVKRGLAA
jgi:hypothetical protein